MTTRAALRTLVPRALRLGTALLHVAVVTACGGSSAAGPVAGPASTLDARPALVALQASRFDEAETLANDFIAKDPSNALAHAVAAITLYKRTVHDVMLDVIAVGAGAAALGSINHRYASWALEQARERLAQVSGHLEVAQKDPTLRMPLCLACWVVDWNKDGTPDERDARLLEVEVDENGQAYEDGDPRRRPTFVLDQGDVYWASAMLKFQRLLFAVVSAYDYSEIDKLYARFLRETQDNVATIRLRDAGRIAEARALALGALADAAQCRTLYLAETDDEGEWLPNPSQKNHPLPLPVTAALYDTWGSVLEDLRRLVAGEEGLDVAAVAQLGDHTWENPPKGFLDVGRLFATPGDLVIDRRHLAAFDHSEDQQSAATVLKDIFGDKYVPQMRSSGLTRTITRIKGELDRGEESFERKLRYLFWLN